MLKKVHLRSGATIKKQNICNDLTSNYAKTMKRKTTNKYLKKSEINHPSDMLYGTFLTSCMVAIFLTDLDSTNLAVSRLLVCKIQNKTCDSPGIITNDVILSENIIQNFTILPFVEVKLLADQ